MRGNSRIVLTEPDVQRLRAILGARSGSLHDRAHLLDLMEELERARVVAAHEVSSDVITMQSEVCVRDRQSGELRKYTLAFPMQADVASGHISVLAPLGTALLGFREGDDVEWQMPGGMRRLRIEKVRQPGRLRGGRADSAADLDCRPAAA